VIIILILLSGCALTKERINLDYAPQKNIATIRGSENVGLIVNVTDARQIRDNVGYKKNAYGMELGEIIPHNDIVELVRESIQTKLRDRGFNVNGTDASVDIQLVRFYNNFKNRFFSADASAEVIMGATVKDQMEKYIIIK
jgi:uncharacterized lipoprotein YajG